MFCFHTYFCCTGDCFGLFADDTDIFKVMIFNMLLLHGHFCCDSHLLLGWIFWLLILYNLSIKLGVCYNLWCGKEKKLHVQNHVVFWRPQH